MRALVVVLALGVAASASAQPAAPQGKRSAGCKDSPVVPRLEGCTVRECDDDEYDEAELQTGPVDGTGDFPKRLVEGRFSSITYVCPRATTTAAIARKTLAALRRSGYTVVYTGRMFHSDLPGFTARKARQWVQVVSEAFDEGTGYTVTSVQAVIDEPMSTPSIPGAAPRKGRKTTR